jgi:Na+/proline symporter
MSHCGPSSEIVNDGAALESAGFGTPLYVTLSIYLAFLFGIGIYFWLKGRNKVASMEDHYKPKGGFGPLVLTMTILATAFSGFTVVGVPADAYANGFLALRWIGGLQVVGTVRLLFVAFCCCVLFRVAPWVVRLLS